MASGEPESSGVGGDAAKHDREDKLARMEHNKKQNKLQAAASGEASTVLIAGERQNPLLLYPRITFPHVLLFFTYTFTHNSRHYLF